MTGGLKHSELQSVSSALWYSVPDVNLPHINFVLILSLFPIHRQIMWLRSIYILRNNNMHQQL